MWSTFFSEAPKGKDIGSKTFYRGVGRGHFLTFTDYKFQVPAQSQVEGGGGGYIDWCIMPQMIAVKLNSVQIILLWGWRKTILFVLMKG